MRKLLAALVLLVLINYVPTYAMDATSSSRREVVQQNIQERKEALKEKIEQRKEEIQNRIEARKEGIASKAAEIRRRLTERRREIIRRHFARMYKRFQAAVARMNKVADRIESRLDKMEERGIDVSGLRADLLEARDDLGVAEGLLEGLEEKVEEALAADDPKAAFEVVKDTIHETRDLLKSVHQQLVEIIRLIKGQNTPTDEATESATP